MEWLQEIQLGTKAQRTFSDMNFTQISVAHNSAGSSIFIVINNIGEYQGRA
jgi:hypothetical protein